MEPTTIAQMLAGYAQPARPFTPTPPTAEDLSNYLYGPPPQSDVQSLPAWLPPNVQSAIRNEPSYAEGEIQGMGLRQIQGAEPPQPNAPQIDDIQRLFNRGIMQNAPTSNPIRGPFLKSIIQGGHLFGGDQI